LSPRTITDALLRAIKPPETGRVELFDHKVPGLVVRVTPTGAISYSFRKMLHGRHLRHAKVATRKLIEVLDKLAVYFKHEIQRFGLPA
jgi:hypothetical protein